LVLAGYNAGYNNEGEGEKRRGDKEEKLITTNPRRMVKVSLP